VLKQKTYASISHKELYEVDKMKVRCITQSDTLHMPFIFEY